MNFNQRLILAFVAPAVLFVAGLAGSIWSLMQTQSRFDQYINTEQAIASGVQEMYAQGLQMGQALRNIVLDPNNPQAYKNLDGAREAFDAAHTGTLEVARGTASEAALAPLAGLRADQAKAQDKVLELVKSGSGVEAVQALNAQETPAWRKLRGALLELGKASRALGCPGAGAVGHGRGPWPGIHGRAHPAPGTGRRPGGGAPGGASHRRGRPDGHHARQRLRTEPRGRADGDAERHAHAGGPGAPVQSGHRGGEHRDRQG
ncbi:MCP four helix bundle domain-containing protein, partial [Hydrogenophaga intermedia]